MATKQAVNKTQAVRDYLNANPVAVPSEIVAALDERGIKVTPSYVAAIKTQKTRSVHAHGIRKCYLVDRLIGSLKIRSRWLPKQ